MSLDTLLEAAQFLEWSNPAASKARGGEVTEFHHYAKSGPESGGRKNSVSSDKSVDSDGELRRRPGGAGTREVHNKLEKNRRAHLKECFENLKQQVPNMEDKKTSNLSILRGALRYIQVLKRREKELEQEMQKLAQEKIVSQEKLGTLKTDLATLPVEIDIGVILANCVKQDLDDTHSDSTATADNEPIISDDEDGHKKPLLVTMVTSQSSMPPPSVVVKPPASGTVTFAVPKVPVTPNSVQSRQAKQLTLNSLIQKPLTPTTYVSPLGSTVTTTNVCTPLNITTLQPAKTHVTQMLQQTIAQRVQLQQLNQQKLQVLQQQPNITGTINQATSPQVITVNASSLAGLNAVRPFTVRPMTAQLRPNYMALPGTIVAGTSILAASPTLGQASLATTSLGNLASMTTSTTNTTMAATTYKLATGPATVTSASSTAPSTQPIHFGNQIVTLSAGNLGTTSVPAGQAVTIGTQGVTIGTQALTLATMKQIIAAPYTGLPTAQIVSPAQIQQLVAHQAAQQQAAQQAARIRGQVPHIVTATATGGQPVITSIPVTQLVSPVTVMSPNMAVTPAGGLTVSPAGGLTVSPAGGLSQAQAQVYNTALSSQVLKSLGQLPVLQPSAFTLPIKPVFMVSMPNVTTTTAISLVSTPSTATVQVAMPTIPVSNTS